MHGIPAEVSASTLDALFGVEVEAVAVEEWPRGETDVGGDTRRTNGTQRGLDALIEFAGNTMTGKRGMSEKKVEVAVVGVGSKARKLAARLGDDGVEMRKTLPPACGIGWNGSPRSNLLRRVVARRQRANRSGVSLNDAV